MLNALIQPFQQPERQYEHWVTAREDMGRRLSPPANERRDDFVERCFRRVELDQVVVVRKAREPARILR